VLRPPEMTPNSFAGRIEIGRDETPMAQSLATGEPIDGMEGIVERPMASGCYALNSETAATEAVAGPRRRGAAACCRRRP
jgi:hypothetical protein